jgi:hypothetical protein
MLNKLIIVAVSMTLVGCFANKPVLVVDRSTAQEGVNSIVHSSNLCFFFIYYSSAVA